MEIIFWTAVLLPVYSYAVFPPLILIVGALARVLRRPVAGFPPDTVAAWPSVAVVVSAYNEEQDIAGLIGNVQALQYPQPLTLYVGSDGSSDRTPAILEAHAGPRVRVFNFDHNRGKASVLNDLVAVSTEPVIAFTDANTRLASDAVRHLVAHFADPRVGVVCGELTLRPEGDANNADGTYWRFERALKLSEGALGALLGANGSIYVIRRECFVPLPPDTLVDDFCIAMTAAMGGRALRYEPKAQAHETVPSLMRDEFNRRVRIGIGNYQAFFRHPEYLLRANPIRSFAYLSHKVLRWFTPHLLLLAFIASTLLRDRMPYRALWWLQVAGYGACLVLYLLSDRMRLPKLLRLPVFLAAMNVAFGVGFWRYVTGRYSGSWRRTVRA
jgi:cellulose synthase/poly-beta-1,6-N-acetylglucosamine synthase-like glycosyltransferase